MAAPAAAVGPFLMDGLAACALTAVAIGGLIAHVDINVLDGDGEAFRALDVLAITLVLLQTGSLVLRRSAPVLTLTLAGGGLLLYSMLDYAPSLASFGFLAALYTVAAYRNRRISVPAGIAAVCVVSMVVGIGRQPVAPDTFVADHVIVAAAWFLGEGLRLRRLHMVRLEDRASRLEREREERARQAVADERRVIARELHDVVAHNVSVIVAQAGAAGRILDAAPKEARTALEAIEQTGREALVEMRRLTGFLRTQGNGAARDPQPSLTDLGALARQLGEAGVWVTVRVEGRVRPLAKGLDGRSTSSATA
jgi:signal transduction histidine kinase